MSYYVSILNHNSVNLVLIISNPINMKNFINVLMLMLVSIGVSMAQEKNGPVLKWEQDRYDYGVVYLDDLPETKLNIKFMNDGDQPLILTQVRACCGTRVNLWPRDPIMPGDEGNIEVEFRLAPRPHRISRTVTVTTNAENPTSVFRIVGEAVER
jgi:hypothetical protein